MGHTHKNLDVEGNWINYKSAKGKVFCVIKFLQTLTTGSYGLKQYLNKVMLLTIPTKYL